MVYEYRGLTGLHPELGMLIPGLKIDTDVVRSEVMDSLLAGGMLKLPDAQKAGKKPAPTAAPEN